jgi:hypothetical protein
MPTRTLTCIYQGCRQSGVIADAPWDEQEEVVAIFLEDHRKTTHPEVSGELPRLIEPDPMFDEADSDGSTNESG